MKHLARKACVFGALAIGALLATPSTVSANPNPNLSCRASALRVNILSLPKIEPVVANAKDLPCDSGRAGLMQFNNLGTPQIKTGLLAAKTVATVTSAHAEAFVAKADINIAGIPRITADVLTSSADVQCVNGAPVMSGTSDVVNVKIGNTQIQAPVGPATFNLGIATLFLNETTSAPDRLTVRALHLVAPGLAEVVIAESSVDFHGQPCCPPQVGAARTGEVGIETGGGC